jgi:hypothetical protein
MRTKALLPVLIALVVGVGVGLLIGLATGSDKGSRGPATQQVADADAERTSEVAETDTPRRAPEPEPPAPAPAAQVPRADPEPARTEAGGDALQAWLDTLGLAGPEAGDGRIFGVVVSDGIPVAGATIRAEPLTGLRHPGADSGMPRVLEYYARVVAYSELGRVTAVTDARGNYELTGLADVDYRIHVEAQGYRVLEGGDRLRRVRPSQRVDVAVSRVGHLEVDVRLPDGSQPAGATVRAGTVGHLRWTPESRVLALAPGSHRVRVSSSGYETTEGIVDIREGEQATFTAELVEQTGIRLSVSVAGRVDLVGRVIVYVNQNGRTVQNASSSDTTFTHVFAPLQPGKYRLRVVENLRTQQWEKEVEVTDGLLDVRMEVTPEEPEQAGDIPVRVLRPDGSPASGARFDVRTVGRTSGGGARPSPVPGGDGLYWVPRPEVLDPANARHYITVKVPGLGVRVVEYGPTDRHEVTVRFEDSARLTVHIPRVEESPYRQRLMVYLTSIDFGENVTRRIPPPLYDSRELPFERSPLPESIVFGDVQPGTYGLVFAEVLGLTWRPLKERTVQLVSGPNSQTLSMPELYLLTLTTPPGESRQVHIRDSEGEEVWRGLIRETTEIGVLRAGHYDIIGRRGRMRIYLSEETKTELVLVAPTAQELSGIGDSGPVYDMGLRDGDLVIAVDGEDPQDSRKLRELMLGFHVVGTNKWTVIRNGNVMEIEVDAGEVRHRFSSGEFTATDAYRD